MTHVLMVCTANICRSPMAQVVATHWLQRQGLADAIRVDSAGTHAGKGRAKPDTRAQAALVQRGYTVKKTGSRKVEPKDFERFDLILAMDRDNLAALQAQCPPEHQHKLRLFLETVAVADEVPDPYYGNAQGFERVLDLCEAGVEGWLRTFAAQAR